MDYIRFMSRKCSFEKQFCTRQDQEKTKYRMLEVFHATGGWIGCNCRYSYLYNEERESRKIHSSVLVKCICFVMGGRGFWVFELISYKTETGK